MTQFIFNEYGVCTNPNKISRVITKPYWFSFSITTAKTSGGYWIYGCSVSLNNGYGFGKPCSLEQHTIFFDDEPSAKYAAYITIKNYMLKHKTGSSSSEADTTVRLWEPSMMDIIRESIQPKLF